MKLFDMGTTMDDEMVTAVAEGEVNKDEEKSYPKLYLNTKELPSLEGVSIGQKVILHFEAEITGVNKREETIAYDIELKSGAVMDGGKSIMKETEADDEDLPIKNKSDYMNDMMSEDED